MKEKGGKYAEGENTGAEDASASPVVGHRGPFDVCQDVVVLAEDGARTVVLGRHTRTAVECGGGSMAQSQSPEIRK
jgi:hypothetical protein